MTMLLEWVCTSTFLILVVLALRAALKKRISARLRYALWAVVLVRLLVPVQLFTSPVAGTWVFQETSTQRSVQNVTADQPQTGSESQTAADADLAAPVLSVPEGFPNAPQAPAVPTAPEAPNPPDFTPELAAVLGWVWLTGAAALALTFLIANLRFALRLRRVRVPMEPADCPLRVYAAVGLPSPCLFGLFRPAVYVTPEAAADPAMLRHILTHELTHFRHLDHIWNILRCAALSVHWWNPLVWLAVSLSRRDGELACDEGALARLGDGERSAYGRTLLSLVTAKPRPADLLCCATTMAGDKKNLRERVERIAKAPRRLAAAALAAVLVLGLACACAFGRAAEPDLKGDQWNESEHLGADVDTESVPDEVIAAAKNYVAGQYAYFVKNPDERLLLGETPAQFDDWRVESLEGPWSRTVPDMELEVWRMVYTYHTTTPEQVKIILAGGMNLTEDGWLTPTSSVTYLIFQKEETGVLRYAGLMESGSGGVQPDQSNFWTQVAQNLLSVSSFHYPTGAAGFLNVVRFTADVSGVPEDVLLAASDYVWEQYERFQAMTSWSFCVGEDGSVLEPGPIEFDDWRVNYFEGPWSREIDGTTVEVWRINYELHTTQPERAERAIVGGMYLTEDDWFCPTYPTCTYLVFCMDGSGGRRYLTSTMRNDCGPEPDSGGERFWSTLEQNLHASWNSPDQGETVHYQETGCGGVLQGRSKFTLHENEPPIYLAEALPYINDDPFMKYCRFAVVDMDWDGTDEVLVWACGVAGDCAGYVLLDDRDGEVYGEVFNAQNNSSHRWFNELKTDGTFKCSDSLGTVWESISKLSFQDGGVISKEDLAVGKSSNHEEFDSFEVNHQTATKAEFEAAVAEQNAKPDAVWYDFTPEDIALKAAMEGSSVSDKPVLRILDEHGTQFYLSYQGNDTRFEGVCDCNWYRDGPEPLLLDLNGDGRDEIVVTMVTGHGTGAFTMDLHIFDAETLEQYNCTGYSCIRNIIDQVSSHADEDNFYLTAPGVDVTIPKPDEGYHYLDSVCLDTNYSFEVEDGRLYCRMGCALDTALLCYIGELTVELALDGPDLVCRSFAYSPSSL